MQKALAVLLTITLTGCTAAEQRIVLVQCLEKCRQGDAACITACGNLLKANCP